MVEVQCADLGHSIRTREQDLGGEPADRSCRRRDDELVERVDHGRAGEEHHSRRLSGVANVYQRISPRRTGRLPTLAVPGRTVVVLGELVGTHRLGLIRARVARPVAGGPQHELRQPYLLVVREFRDERQQILDGQRLRH